MGDANEKWRTVIVGLPIIRKLLNGEDVELGTFRINLIPDDVLWNNRSDLMVLFGNDVLTAQRIFKAREALGGQEPPLAERLAEHWLSQMDCDHNMKRDRAVCCCGFVTIWEPTVGDAAKAWAEHALAAVEPSSGTGAK